MTKQISYVCKGNLHPILYYTLSLLEGFYVIIINVIYSCICFDPPSTTLLRVPFGFFKREKKKKWWVRVLIVTISTCTYTVLYRGHQLANIYIEQSMNSIYIKAQIHCVRPVLFSFGLECTVCCKTHIKVIVSHTIL